MARQNTQEMIYKAYTCYNKACTNKKGNSRQRHIHRKCFKNMCKASSRHIYIYNEAGRQGMG